MLRDVESNEGADEDSDSEKEMEGVDAGDEIEEVAALVGAEEDVLGGEFLPGDPLAGQEESAEDYGGREPGESSASDGFADAEPLVHDVGFAEHGASGDLHGCGGEKKDGGVEPEDAGDDGGNPLVDVVVVGVDVSGGLINEEGADDGDEEHEVAGESEEDTEAVAVESLVGAAAAVGALVPVVAVSSSAGALVGWRTAA